jgi:hypothetical protein
MHTNTAEYFPDTSEARNGNGHHNGNGNGHRPPFKLAPIESPEEEARTEVLREIAPKIRRKVREDTRLSAGAKFFFYALFDDAFWHAVGGHGTGQVFADIRTLGERYGHDEKSVMRWRYELEEAGWLWTRYEWPMTEWRLTPLLPKPADSPHKRAVQMSLGRATKPVGETPTTYQNGVNKGQNRGTPTGNGQKDRRPWASRPSRVGETPDARGRLGGEVVGETPTSDRQNAHDLPAKRPRATGKTPTSDGHDAHEQPEKHPRPAANGARPLGSNGWREKTPRRLESGAIEGKGTPPGSDFESEFKEWKGTLAKLYPAELKQILIELQNERQKLSELSDKQTKAHGKPGPKTLEALRRASLKVDAVKARLTGPR